MKKNKDKLLINLHKLCQKGKAGELIDLLQKYPNYLEYINTQLFSGLSGVCGYRALHNAVLAQNVEVLIILLDHGADINRVSVGGYTPLHIAASCGAYSCIQLLLSRGASTEALDDCDNTALMTADNNRHYKCKKLLFSEDVIRTLKAGKNAEFINYMRKLSGKEVIDSCFDTCLIIAVENNNYKVVGFLMMRQIRNKDLCLEKALSRSDKSEVALILVLCIAVQKYNNLILEILLFDEEKIIKKPYYLLGEVEIKYEKILELRRHVRKLADYFSLPVSIANCKRNYTAINIFLQTVFCKKQQLEADWRGLSLRFVREEWFRALHNYKKLDLSQNSIETMPKMNYKQLLNNLLSLDLRCNNMEKIPNELLQLPKLRILDLSYNQLKLLPDVKFSSSLTTLRLEQNKLDKFPANAKGSNITRLNISKNCFNKIPDEILELKNLENLNISDNINIHVLPAQLANLKNLQPIDLQNLEISDPPLKYQENFTRMMNYLRAQLRSAKPYYKMKLMIIGSYGHGKTTLLKRLKDEKDMSRTPATRGIEIHDVNINKNGKTFDFSVWDFAGENDYYTTHQTFLSSRSLYILVWDASQGSFGIKELASWLENLIACVENFSVVILGTKLDQLPKEINVDEHCKMAEIEINNLIENMSAFRNMKHFVEARAFKNLQDFDKSKQIKVKFVSFLPSYQNYQSGLDDLKTCIYDLAEQIKDNDGIEVMGQMVPQSYIMLEKEIKKISANNEFPILTQNEVIEIGLKLKCNEDSFNESDIHAATLFLHDIGAILHYNDANENLKGLYFINPSWLSELMSKFITVPAAQNFVRDGILKRDDIPHILKNHWDCNQPDLIKKYLRLLWRFQVACVLDENQILVPSKLPDVRPDLSIEVDPSSLLTRYHFLNCIPYGFWTRFLSRFLLIVPYMLDPAPEFIGKNQKETNESNSASNESDLDSDTSSLSFVFDDEPYINRPISSGCRFTHDTSQIPDMSSFKINASSQSNVAFDQPTNKSDVTTDKPTYATVFTIDEPTNTAISTADQLKNTTDATINQPTTKVTTKLSNLNNLTMNKQTDSADFTIDQQKNTAAISTSHLTNITNATMEQQKEKADVNINQPKDTIDTFIDLSNSATDGTINRSKNKSDVMTDRSKNKTHFTTNQSKNETDIIIDQPENLTNITTIPPSNTIQITANKPENLTGVITVEPTNKYDAIMVKSSNKTDVTISEPKNTTVVTTVELKGTTDVITNQPANKSDVTSILSANTSDVTINQLINVTKVTTDKQTNTGHVTVDQLTNTTDINVIQKKNTNDVTVDEPTTKKNVTTYQSNYAADVIVNQSMNSNDVSIDRSKCTTDVISQLINSAEVTVDERKNKTFVTSHRPTNLTDVTANQSKNKTNVATNQPTNITDITTNKLIDTTVIATNQSTNTADLTVDLLENTAFVSAGQTNMTDGNADKKMYYNSLNYAEQSEENCVAENFIISCFPSSDSNTSSEALGSKTDSSSSDYNKNNFGEIPNSPISQSSIPDISKTNEFNQDIVFKKNSMNKFDCSMETPEDCYLFDKSVKDYYSLENPADTDIPLDAPLPFDTFTGKSLRGAISLNNDLSGNRISNNNLIDVASNNMLDDAVSTNELTTDEYKDRHVVEQETVIINKLADEDHNYEEYFQGPTGLGYLFKQGTLKCWKNGIIFDHKQVFFSVQILDSTLKTDFHTIETKVTKSILGYRVLGYVVDHIRTLINEWYESLIMETSLACPRCTYMKRDPPYLFSVNKAFEAIHKSKKKSCNLLCKYNHKPIDVNLIRYFPDLTFDDLPRNMKLAKGDFQIRNTIIGRGQYIVYKGVCKGIDAAIKCYDLKGEKLYLDAFYEVRQEIIMLSHLRKHPYIIRFLGFSLEFGICSITERARHGSLASVIYDDIVKITRLTKYRIVQQISSALAFIHKKHIIHRDIKSQNILLYSLESDAGTNIKITDFGTANFINPTGMNNYFGTNAYTAPEVKSFKDSPDEYTSSVDIYSFAMVIYELITSKQPFYETVKSFEVDRKVKNGMRPIFYDIPHAVFGLFTLTQLMQKMWAQEGYHRPTAVDVYNQLSSHEFQLLYGVFELYKPDDLSMACYVDVNNELWVACHYNKVCKIVVFSMINGKRITEIIIDKISQANFQYFKPKSIININKNRVCLIIRSEYDICLFYDVQKKVVVNNLIEETNIRSIRANENLVFIGLQDGRCLQETTLNFINCKSLKSSIEFENKEKIPIAMATCSDFLLRSAGKWLVYRNLHKNEEGIILCHEFLMINGIVISPDQSLFFVTFLSSSDIYVHDARINKEQGKHLWQFLYKISCCNDVLNAHPSSTTIDTNVTCVCCVFDTLWVGTCGGNILIYKINDQSSVDLLIVLWPYKHEVKQLLFVPQENNLQTVPLVISTGRKVNRSAFGADAFLKFDCEVPRDETAIRTGDCEPNINSNAKSIRVILVWNALESKKYKTLSDTVLF